STSWGETGGYSAVAKQMAIRVLDTLRSVPGVESAATAYWLPGVPASYSVEMKSVEGRAETEPKMIAQGRAVSPGYFAVMHIPLLGGELCRDDPNTSHMMVNRSFANAYLGGSAAIGHHLTQPGNSYVGTAAIRGVVGDARETGLDREPVPTVYWCFGSNQPGSFFLVRTRGAPQAMAETLRRKVHEIEPRRSVFDLTPLTDHISYAYAENRLGTTLLACFA